MTYMHLPSSIRPFRPLPLRLALSWLAILPAQVAGTHIRFFLALAACVTGMTLFSGEGRAWLELIWLAAAIGAFSLCPTFRKERHVAILARGSILLTTGLALVEIVANLPWLLVPLLGATTLWRGSALAGHNCRLKTLRH